MNRRGFTLIELMLVVTMIGILSAIAIPKFSETIRRAQEARTKGNLAILKSAITMYFAETGNYPTQLEQVTQIPAAVIDRIPLKYTPPYHPEGNSVSNGAAADQAASRGDWFYFNSPGDAQYGQVVVNCVHTDMAGRIWTAF